MSIILDTLDTLNAQHELPNALHFAAGPGEFPIAHMRSEHAEATVSVYGGHVLSFTPKGKQPVLWVSNLAEYREGKAIRGGIPVIWPWFGPSSSPDLPSHGFARNQFWSIESSRLQDDNTPVLELVLKDNASSQKLWPHSFTLKVVITLTNCLKVELISTNTGSSAVTCTGALHTYFNISAIENVKISGLDEGQYLDQLTGDDTLIQAGPIHFEAETDRIYFNSSADCILHDSGFDRRVLVEKRGSQSTVVWNPWIDKAKRMGDFGDEEYKQMVCIETANAGTDVITLEPGESHTLTTCISVLDGDN